MNRIDDRLLAVLLLCVQALVWPGAALVRGAAPDASALLVAVLVAGSVTAALALRRARPVATLVLVAVACALGAGPLPTGATAVLGTAGVGLALFTVAAERDTFTAVLCVVALALWQLLQSISLHGLSERDGLDLVLTALLYAVTCGAGLVVRRARRARRTAAQLLERAEAERHRLPAVERRRMERELHDVSAHHLTAVVVTAGAALGLRERRPELASEALGFAVETGREVTRALGAVRAPAPSREELPSPEERLRELVTGFRRLGQPVDCEIGPLPDGAVADAAFGIVREALTNVARHAPGAPTVVRCRQGDARTEVVVTSAAPPAGAAAVTAHGAGLGGGRGQGFLRARAREAGGTLTSGPTEEGGWEVRAVLPGRVAGPVGRVVARSYRVAQVVAAAGLLLQPLLPALVIRDETVEQGDGGVSAGLLFALLAAAQVVALMWLRRAPRVAWGALFGLALLWPEAMRVGGYGGPALLPVGLSVLVTCAGVWGWASLYGRGSVGVARAVPRAPGRLGLVAAFLFTSKQKTAPFPAPLRGEGPAVARAPLPARLRVKDCAVPRAPLGLALVAVGVHGLVVVLVGAGQWGVGVWGVGVLVGGALWGGLLRGRWVGRARGVREERMAVWAGEAVRDAWAERRRIAAGLETTVLARTADMVAQAEAGHLDATAERAREALAAMRALLDTVRDGQGEGEREGERRAELRPQPTLQALDLLARQCRAGGRDVEIRVTGRVPERLPTAVDLAAYHAAETVLGAGGEEAAVLEFDLDGDTLTLTATGVPRAARPAVRELLAARAAALGGTLDTDRPGTVGLRLPLAPVPQEADVASASAEERER
ncbi:histidine kinase [Streptomyces dioscori]|uniref:histidine kinase n=1 Tax=Streptomyces dioscori TaxID=2109333 RepID=A0A2P8Q6I8_9ACTN|nr:histidine kinase [Streptomyces dioscori]PSM41874.1 histidine kinase [Streptomyces dioscori]